MPGERIVVSEVAPQVDCGRWPAKACVGDRVRVAATIVRDGHDPLRAVVRHRRGRARWREEPLRFLGNDRFAGSFPVDAVGRWQFEIEAWVDRHAAWLDEHDRKVAAGQTDLAGELAEGQALFGPGDLDAWRAAADALGGEDRPGAARSGPLPVEVERERARAGAWYELFPRSWGGLRGVAEVVPALAEHGFDVLYLPPIHPIGVTNRKGRNNTERAARGDVGSPWAIGAAEGGHDAIDPGLGDEDDLGALVETLRAHGMELALDLALQASPDHPWLAEHPEWFQHRPDGSLKYAENPPKRYQDIHNFDWDTKDQRGLWEAFRTVVLRWCVAGVTVFRVDNPHTKPIPFWEWLIAEVRKRHPETVFLSEAFTRPALTTLLAKAGFSQSYTYFTWKNTKPELVELVEQLREWSPYLRPNLWPNTPDILHATLQQGGRPAFECRLVLAATLSPSYGIYSGYERCENVPVRPGSEEYLDSEKYELRERSLDGPLLPLVTRLNEIRRAHPALTDAGLERLTWLETESEHLLGYAKELDGDVVLAIVNLDPFAIHEGVCVVPWELGLHEPYDVVDALTGESYTWRARNYVRLGPGRSHVLVPTR
ncbi:MAG TPA: maltotransferase domain-containing protein [Gaiella sp.]|nr:maltotransferase domain-containing protein [Gaiella sp.]